MNALQKIKVKLVSPVSYFNSYELQNFNMSEKQNLILKSLLRIGDKIRLCMNVL